MTFGRYLVALGRLDPELQGTATDSLGVIKGRLAPKSRHYNMYNLYETLQNPAYLEDPL